MTLVWRLANSYAFFDVLKGRVLLYGRRTRSFESLSTTKHPRHDSTSSLANT
jgi:hypothetical protein